MATTLKTYALMADNVYKVPKGDELMKGLQGWRVYNMGQGETGLTGGVEHNSGFKGCIYASSEEIVVAYKGTGGGKGFQDFLADVKLATGVIPREASAARNLFKNALKAFKDNIPITLVGHSLGGGLCQVIAFWYNVRFVTFNAPPMGGCIAKSTINFLKPQQMVRSHKNLGNRALGTNYRLKLDVVSSQFTSNYGHYGNVVTFQAPGVGNPKDAHKIGVFRDYLDRSSDGLTTPI